MKVLSIIITLIAAGLLIIGVTQSGISPIIVNDVKADTLAVKISAIDTSNVRIQKWRRYYANDSISHVDRIRRAFYYETVKNLFLEAGFEEERAEIYAEIPSIESNWLANAKSETGVIGMWQVVASTAAIYGIKREQLNDPVTSTRAAVTYIKSLDSLYSGDVAKVLFSYNGGAGTVNWYLSKYRTTNVWNVKFSSQETHEYAPRVLGCYLAMKYDSTK